MHVCLSVAHYVTARRQSPVIFGSCDSSDAAAPLRTLAETLMEKDGQMSLQTYHNVDAVVAALLERVGTRTLLLRWLFVLSFCFVYCAYH